MLSSRLVAQSAPEIIVPGFDDKYSRYVKQLEAGDLDIDYQDFRFSFIDSEQFRIAKKKSSEFDSLKKEMYLLMEEERFPEIIEIAKRMLTIDYTSLIAHKILRQTYKILKDTINSKKYHDIQFGLLRSIVNKGDGKTCQTAWPVIQIAEAYFILDVVLDAEVRKQSIYRTEGFLCDKMEVKEGKKKKTYYFETTKIFEGYKKSSL